MKCDEKLLPREYENAIRVICYKSQSGFDMVDERERFSALKGLN